MANEKSNTTKVKEEKQEKKTNEELAKEIVHSISQVLHLRAGIGPIWRQLDSSRRQEILEKWDYDVTKLLDEYR
jgi:hypothetical protein